MAYWVFCPGEALDRALAEWSERTNWDARAVRDFLSSHEAHEHGLRIARDENNEVEEK